MSTVRLAKQPFQYAGLGPENPLPDFQNILVVDPRYYLGSLEQLIRDEGITDVLFLYNAETM